MGAGTLVALPTGFPAVSRIVDATRTPCVPLPWFSTSVRIDTVASPGRTSLRANVPHCLTCTGFVVTSHTCR